MTPEDQPKLTTQYTERAVKFIGENKDEAVLPVRRALDAARAAVRRATSSRGSRSRGCYGDVIQEIDWSVGEILKALDEHKLADNTLVIFTCDNGPWLSYGNHARQRRGLARGQGDGVGGRRARAVHRPLAGEDSRRQRCAANPAMTIDILPTVAKIIGADLPKRPIDGKDIGPLLRGEPGAKCPHEAYFHYYAQGELQAVRSGKWKLMLPHTYRTMEGQPPGKDGKPGRYRQVKIEKPELYDLDADVGETKNVAAANPEVVKKLLALAETAREDLGDALTKRDRQGHPRTGPPARRSKKPPSPRP